MGGSPLDFVSTAIFANPIDSDLWGARSRHSLSHSALLSPGTPPNSRSCVDALEFSDRLRGVLSNAREEAARLQHEHIGTEHLLIALLNDTSSDGETPRSPAGVVFDVLGVDRAKVKEVLEQTVLRGRVATSDDQLSYTSRAKAVLELAMAEARVAKAGTVDTQHLLLGLLREERGIAAQVLLDFGITIDKARVELDKLRS
jgi:ATP-dependent Clp protease ATP-binding subunit ClpC